ncbi:MAG: hypothetical protein HRU11_01025 [Parvularculaceae bacterium]|nr:hypothetical protein [Parvularculaceae bacterium]
MAKSSDPLRPTFSPSMTGEAFLRWYWPVAELKAACEALGVSPHGLKADLRVRVAHALDHPGEAPAAAAKKPKKSTFKWSQERLTRDTVITDNISFGPKVRGFFKEQIGAKFVCHSDFMDWVRSSEGATLGDAIDAWWMLEQRKDDPSFRRDIAACNNYLRYLRDLRDAHPELSLDEAKACWDEKKIRPAQDGFVVYEPSDLEFLA